MWRELKQLCDSRPQRLFEIESEVRRRWARLTSINKIHNQAEKRLYEWEAQNPKPVLPGHLDGDPELEALSQQYGDVIRVDEFRALQAASRDGSSAAALANYGAAVREWEALHNEVCAEIAYKKKERLYHKALRDVDALLSDAAELPARSIAGLQCKARMIEEFDSEQVELKDSIVDDLLAVEKAA